MLDTQSKLSLYLTCGCLCAAAASAAASDASRVSTSGLRFLPDCSGHPTILVPPFHHSCAACVQICLGTSLSMASWNTGMQTLANNVPGDDAIHKRARWIWFESALCSVPGWSKGNVYHAKFALQPCWQCCWFPDLKNKRLEFEQKYVDAAGQGC